MSRLATTPGKRFVMPASSTAYGWAGSAVWVTAFHLLGTKDCEGAPIQSVIGAPHRKLLSTCYFVDFTWMEPEMMPAL
jgi:hypothetical protein